MARARTTRNNSNPSKTAAAASAITLVPETKRNVTPINVEEEIRRRAYELYEQRGCAPGRDDEDWLMAEREVLARYQQQSA